MDSRSFQNDSDILSCKNFAFVDKVEDFQCVFCKGLYTKQFRLACKHFICRDCKYIKRKGCPTCRYSHEVEIKVAIVHIESEILKLRVRCLNDNCGYINTLKDFQDYHHKICKFSKSSTIIPKSEDDVTELKLEDVKDSKTKNVAPKSDEKLEQTNGNVDRKHSPVNFAKPNNSGTFVKNQVSRFAATPHVDNNFQMKFPPVILSRSSFKTNDVNFASAGFIPRKAPIPLPKTRTKIAANKSYLSEDVNSKKGEVPHQHQTKIDEIKNAATVQNNILSDVLLETTNAEMNGQPEEIREEKFEQIQHTTSEQVQNMKEFTALKSSFKTQADKNLVPPPTPPRTILKNQSASLNEFMKEDKQILVNKSYFSENLSSRITEVPHSFAHDEIKEAPKVRNNILYELLLDNTDAEINGQPEESPEEQIQHTTMEQVQNSKEFFAIKSNFKPQTDKRLERFDIKLPPPTPPRTATLKSLLGSPNKFTKEDKQVKPVIDEKLQLQIENVNKKLFEAPKNQLMEVNGNASETKFLERELFNNSTITNQLLDLNNNQRDIFNRNLRFEDELNKLVTRYNKMEAMLIEYNSRIDDKIGPIKDEMESRLEEILDKVNQQNQINLELTKKIDGRRSSFNTRNEQMYKPSTPDFNVSESIQQQNQQISTLEDSNELILQQLNELKDDIKANSMLISMCLKRSEEDKQKMNEISVNVANSGESLEEIKKNLKPEKSEENQSIYLGKENVERKSKLDIQTEIIFADLKQRVEDISQHVNANEEMMNEMRLYVTTSDKSLAEESIVEIAKEVEAVNDRVNQLTKQIEENILEIKEDYNEKVISIKNKVSSTDPYQLIKPLEESVVELRTAINENDVKLKHDELESSLNRHKTSFATIKQQVENICNKVISNEANLNKFQLQVSTDMDLTKESLSKAQIEVASVKEQMQSIPRQLTAKIDKYILEIKELFENNGMKQEAEIINLKKTLGESERDSISKSNNFEDGFTNKFSEWSSDVVKWLEDNQDSFRKQVLNLLKLNSSIPCVDSHPFHTLVYVWEIAEIESKMNQQSLIYRSELFPLPGYSHVAFGVLENQCCQFRLDYYSDNAPQAADKAPFKKVHPKITCVLRDLSDGETPKNVVRAIDCLRSKKMVHEKFDFGRFICSNEMRANYVRNDAVIFEIHVETPSLASKVFSHNGVLFDVIGNYGEKKQLAVEELELSQKSPYFYTAAEGYRMQVLMYLNAIGEYEGNGLTAAIRILTGENDLTLPNSLTYTVTFTIFNQHYPTKHLVRCFEFDVKDENIYIDFESQAVIENEGFVRNDSLFYKVVVQKRGQGQMKKSKSAFKLFK